MAGLTAVVAMTPDGVIGNDGDMPWRLSGDLRRFKRITLGGVLIMGRRTYDSIGRPLPGRRTIVITRNRDWSADGIETAANPVVAVAAVGADRGFVVGGAEIYRLLLEQCETVLLTRVWSRIPGDTVLELELSQFAPIERCRYPATARDNVPSEFLKLVRRKS